MVYYIKKRDNPQLRKPYYIALGKISAKEAKKREETLYGTNTVLKYKTKAEYEKAVSNLKAK